MFPQSVDLLIDGVTIVTMNHARDILFNGAVAIQGTKIVSVGPSAEVVSQVDAKKILHLPGHVVIPGLVNTHGHWPMTLFRGLVDDRPLEAWLNIIWKVEPPSITNENMILGTQLAVAEMIRSGTTCAADMYWKFEYNTRAARAANFRSVNGPSFAKIEGFSDKDRSENNPESYIERYLHDELVHPCIQMHATYTTDAAIMKKVSVIREKYNLPFITHAAESAGEMKNVQQIFGKRPIEVLAENGLLGPSTLLAHCVHLNDEEIELLAKTGSSVSHCPSSNFKLSSGIARVAQMLKAGVNVSLGTDGAASNNDLDLLQEAHLAALVQKAVTGDPSVLPAQQAFEMLTRNGARALGLEEQIGSLEPGKLADLAILDFNQPHLTPCYDLYSHLLYAASKADFRYVIINGKLVMDDRRLTTLDEAEILSNAYQASLNIKKILAPSA